MTAVILAGGKGTRLHPYTFTIPKPLLPVGDVPIIEVLLHQLRNSGFGRVILTLGHMAPIFTASLGDGTRFGLSLEYAYEDEPLGTAGPLRELQGLADDFLVMNGDILTTLSFAELMEAHRGGGAAATIAVSHREVQIDYGVVVSTEEGDLSDYVEKPTIPYEVSMGVNVLNRRAIGFIPEKERFDIPELMVALKAAGERVLCHRTDCYWQDIGRFDDYQQASLDFTSDPARFVGHVQ
jgi:NDP-mannose synthase